MELTKLGSSYQFLYTLSPRRKVVSGFCFGTSLTVITLVLLNYSAKPPFAKPIRFQGCPGLGCKSSIVAWPFSFTSTPVSSSGKNTSPGRAFHETREVDGHPSGLKETGVGINSSDQATSKSFTREEKGDVKAHGPEKSAERGHYVNPSEKGTVAENSSMANLSEGSGNRSFVYRKGKTPQGSFINGNGNGADPPSGNQSHGNTTSSRNSSVVDLPSDKEERAPGTQKTGNFSRKANVTVSSQVKVARRGFYGNCDIFDGRWVRDESKPYYPAGSCPFIDRDFDCHVNGRPDDGFIRWKWQPNECDIPIINAVDFLKRLRGKKLVFVGDSLNRNMWESLVCILRHNIPNKKRVYEISGSRDFKKKGIYAFRFEDYNCTVDFVSSPFLVRESSFKVKNGTIETLRLDLMDHTTSMYHDADIVIFNTGHWWTHEKTSRGEDYYQEGGHLHPRLEVLEAYKRALTTWAKWVDRNINPNVTRVFFRGYSVTHFRGGQWNSGGQCHEETEPIFNETYLEKYPPKMKALEHVLQRMRTPVVYLNISRLTDFRKDAHPSIYTRKYRTASEVRAAQQSQDCSHWCLPGVPDTWNELLYVYLLSKG